MTSIKSWSSLTKMMELKGSVFKHSIVHLQLYKKASCLPRMLMNDLLPLNRTLPSLLQRIQEAPLWFMILSHAKPISQLSHEEGGGFHPKIIFFFFSKSMRFSCFSIELMKNQWSTSLKIDLMKGGPSLWLPSKKKVFLFLHNAHKIQAPALLISSWMSWFLLIFKTYNIWEDRARIKNHLREKESYLTPKFV